MATTFDGSRLKLYTNGVLRTDRAYTGTITTTAGVLTIKALGTTTTCTPANNPKPSLTLDVKGSGGSGGSDDTGSDAGAGATSGSGSDAGSGSGSGEKAGGEELPQTGPTDSAIALGTLGGTVLLAGAAGVLWLTRRNQAARSR